MQPTIRYTVFNTKWGYFTLTAADSALRQTALPVPEADIAKARLLSIFPTAVCDKSLFKALQQQITAYFEGARIDFDLDIPINLDHLPPFTRSVLTVCRQVQFGQTKTYQHLAKKVNRPTAVRAVGTAMAKNSVPLIIPCHRIIQTTGQPGRFSAPGGTKQKQKLLNLEQ